MKLRKTPIIFLIIVLSAGAYAASSSDDLKVLAIQVSEAAKEIAKDGGGINSAENTTAAKMELNQRIAKLEKMADPLGSAFDKPYGHCGEMVKNLYGFIDASAGASAQSKFYFDSYRTSEKECQQQISGTHGNSGDDDLVVLDL